MKTTANYSERDLTLTMDALIFADRNKEYGAYELRTKYKKHLFIGFLFAAFIFGSGISVPLIQAWLEPEVVINKLPPKDPPRMTDFEDPQIVAPKPPQIEIPNMNASRYSASFIIVDTLFETDETLITIEEQLASGDTVAYDPIALVPVEEIDPYVDPDEGNGVVFVTETATFLGGDINDFRIWVQKNLIFPSEAAEIGLNGKVIAEFCVNTKGYVCDVKILRGFHPSVDGECIRTLMNSPKWIPAKQNGRVVKQRFSLPLTFIIR